MKTGLTVSTVAHAALLGFGLVALSAPQALEVADVEAFPVDIVPIETITQIQQGERKAPVAERAAPTPTVRPEPVPMAKNVGDNDTDLQAAPEAEASKREVKTAALPEPEPMPKPVKPAEQPVEKPKSDPTPVPATEVTPEPQPRQEVTPDPAPETAVSESPDAEAVKLPEQAPSPQSRPQPPQAQTAKAPERRDAEKPVEQQPKRAQNERKFDLATVEDLLVNLEDSKGGGALRSTEQAALGGERTTTDQKLSQSEMDALRNQLGGCWSIPVGVLDSDKLRTSVRFSLDQTGRLSGQPRIDSTSGNQEFDESAVRAVHKCDKAGLLVPEGKYEVWAEVLVNFDPSEMF